MRTPHFRPFAQVDVFTSVPYRGNPLAVVSDADGLTTDEMQRFAAWTNLSETTFLLTPTSEHAGGASRAGGADRAGAAGVAEETGGADGADRAGGSGGSGGADYRVRIFTPDRELPFAGHPTLGSCRVWLDQGGVPRRRGEIVQECGAGLVAIRSSESPGGSRGGGPGGSSRGRPSESPGGSPSDSPGGIPGGSPGAGPDGGPGGGRLAFAAPPLVRSGPVSAEDLAAACAILGIDPDGPDSPVVDANWVANGPPWMAVLLRSADEVLGLRPDAANPQGLFIGAVGPHRHSAPPGSTGSSGSADYAGSSGSAGSPGSPGDAGSLDSPDCEVRAFFPLRGRLVEDPVTGSLNASLGQWLTAAGHATAPYTASQGAALGRDGRIYVESDADGTIWVGGDTVTCIQGIVDIGSAATPVAGVTG